MSRSYYKYKKKVLIGGSKKRMSKNSKKRMSRSGSKYKKKF